MLRQVYEQMSSGLLKQLGGPNRWLSLDLAGHLALLGNSLIHYICTYTDYGRMMTRSQILYSPKPYPIPK